MNAQENVYRVRAVIYFDRGWWEVQCLEYDIGTCSKRREDLPRKLLKQLRGQIALDLLQGKRPFETFPRAPERFWKLYELGTPLGPVAKESWRDRLLGRFSRNPKLQTEITLAPAAA
jgi:hypothetical protein